MKKDTVVAMRAYLEVALQGFEEYFGVQAEVGKISYGDSHADIKLKVSQVNADGTVEPKEAADFKRYAHVYGLRPEWMGGEFKQQGKTFVITGLNTRARKFRVQATSTDGVRYKFPQELIKRLMETA